MKKLLLLVMAVVLVGGCGTFPAERASLKNNANLPKLSIGMTKAKVLEIMGSAKTTEAYETKTGGTLEYLIYETKAEWRRNSWYYSDTPICIIDGKLKGWGRNFYDDTIKIRKEIIKKDN